MLDRHVPPAAVVHLLETRPAVRSRGPAHAVSDALVIAMDAPAQETAAVSAAADRAALDELLDQLTDRQITQLVAVCHALGVCNSHRQSEVAA